MTAVNTQKQTPARNHSVSHFDAQQKENVNFVNREVLITEATSASHFKLCVTSFDDESDSGTDNLIKSELV